MVTLQINGIQVDIQAAIVIDTAVGTQVSYEHVYFARVNPGGANSISAFDALTPCSQSPCINGGSCIASKNETFKCICTTGWKGRTILVNLC